MTCGRRLGVDLADVIPDFLARTLVADRRKGDHVGWRPPGRCTGCLNPWPQPTADATTETPNDQLQQQGSVVDAHEWAVDPEGVRHTDCAGLGHHLDHLRRQKPGDRGCFIRRTRLPAYWPAEDG